MFSPQHFEKAEQKEIRKQDWSLMQTSRKSKEKQKGKKKTNHIQHETGTSRTVSEKWEDGIKSLLTLRCNSNEPICDRRSSLAIDSDPTSFIQNSPTPLSSPSVNWFKQQRHSKTQSGLSSIIHFNHKSSNREKYKLNKNTQFR